MQKRICHLTSAHPRYDIRIFIKMCHSLVANGYVVLLVVADGKGDEQCNGIEIFDVGASKGRINRILRAPSRVYEKAITLHADIYHLHDPELIPIGLKLRKKGMRVVFDSHEDVPKQMLYKSYLFKPLLWLISKGMTIYEKWALKKLNGIITATPHIRNKLLNINTNTIDINNYPILNELITDNSWDNKKAEICFLGGIDKNRGIQEIVSAMELIHSSAKLNLCGQFSESHLEQKMKTQRGWIHVNAMGIVSRKSVREVLARSLAGIVTLLPVPNHIEAQPIKMFEYMSAGIPIIASDFPLWREMVTDNKCGLLVDPLNPQAIADSIDYLITHPKEAMQMGENGRKAIVENFNWMVEEKKLLSFYENILSI